MNKMILTAQINPEISVNTTHENKKNIKSMLTVKMCFKNAVRFKLDDADKFINSQFNGFQHLTRDNSNLHWSMKIKYIEEICIITTPQKSK